MHEAHHKKEVFVCHTCTLPFFSFGDKQKHLPNCKPLQPSSTQPIINGEKANANVAHLVKGDHAIATNAVVGVKDSIQSKSGLAMKQSFVVKERTGMRASPRLRNDAMSNETLPETKKIIDEASANLAKAISHENNESLSKENVSLSLNDKSKMNSLGNSAHDDTSNETRLDKNDPHSATKTKYTKSLPLSPLNFHGFLKPSNEMETVEGLGDFRDGLNAYATEYFIGDAVFNTNLFESSIVTDSMISLKEEEIPAATKNDEYTVPDTTEQKENE